MATAATPGSTAAPPEPAPAPDAFVHRFGGTERALHWVHAVGFFGMLASGLVLYLPSLSASIGDRPTMKAIHLAVAVGWMVSVGLVSITGDRRALRRTRAELEHFLDDDLRWLRGRKVPQGRFNAGQKSHAVLQAALAGLFVLSGVLLWLGERSAAFRFPGTVAVHDGAMFFAGALVLGHLFLALVWPATRPALRGVVRGTVRADWAARHHAAWAPDELPAARAPVGRGRLAVAGVLLVAGVGATVFVVEDSLVSSNPSPSAPSASAAPTNTQPTPPGPDVLAGQGRQALQAGAPADAVALLGQAVALAPDRGDLRTSLGFALAQTGDLEAAEGELRQATRLAPDDADGHLILGSVLLQRGNRRAGRRELRRVVRLAPDAPNADLARRLLRQSEAG